MTPPTGTRRESPVPSGVLRPSSRADDDITRSDNENDSEKPVREKLREATITGEARGRLLKKRSFEDVDNEDGEEKKEEPRHVRKRSREAVPGSDVVVGEEAINGTQLGQAGTPDPASDPRDEEDPTSGITSPKNKRTRDQVLQDETAAKTDAGGAAAQEIPADFGTPSDDRKTKKLRESPPISKTDDAMDSTKEKVPAASGFANASVTSPFAVFGAKSPQPPSTADTASVPQSSDEKFKKSGFGAFATDSTSPFGASGSKSPFGAAVSGTKSPFASTGPTASPWAAKPTTSATQPSAFGGAASDAPKSGFGNTSSTSAFGTLSKPTLGGGFGGTSTFGGFGAIGDGTKHNVFAGGSGPTIQGLSNKKTKAFGAANDTDEDTEGSDEEAAEDGTKATAYDGEVKKDKRFYEQNIETGEEDETTVFGERARIYEFVRATGKWVERGMGIFKLNVSDSTTGVARDVEEGKVRLMDAPADDDESEDGKEAQDVGKKTARFIMRALGSQRVILNSKVHKDMKFGDGEGKAPTGMNVLFSGHLVDGETKELKLATLQLKMKAENAKALWHAVTEVQEEL